ncbi:MAG: hypothetical protein ACOYBM_05490 [Dethiobacteria bacterium]|jgi:hypothetical protein|nr:hypothetical protein [Bacillota bacterium]
MRLMHTALPEFILKIKQTVMNFSPAKSVIIRGLESLKSGKFQTLRTGRIQVAVADLASQKDIDKLELVIVPRVPETMHSIIIKGYDASGKPVKAIVESINIIHPTEDIELEGFKEVEDRRPPLGDH